MIAFKSEPIEKRDDGTFVVLQDGGEFDGAPYHATPDYDSETWEAVLDMLSGSEAAEMWALWNKSKEGTV